MQALVRAPAWRVLIVCHGLAFRRPGNPEVRAQGPHGGAGTASRGGHDYRGRRVAVLREDLDAVTAIGAAFPAPR